MPPLSLESFDLLEKRLGYNFKDRSILIQALTHKSHTFDDKRRNYELLEFLGDSIINLFVVEILVSEFGNLREGDLAPMKAFFVSEDFLASLAQELNLASYILAKGGKSDIRNNASIMADVFEALWAGIYIDSNRDLNYVRDLFNKLYKKVIVEKIKSHEYKRDYKTILQEITQKKWKERPTYRVISITGPQHNKTFQVECFIRDYRTIGVGKSKKEAEQDCAKKLIDLLESIKV